jgi:hypothetical protein
MSGLDNELKQRGRETKSKVDKDPLLFHLRFLAMKDYHIELYKILKNTSRNKDNIFRLLEREMRMNPKAGGVVKLVLEHLINSNSAITVVCDVRDKFYAHLDKDFEKYIRKKSYAKDIQSLFELIEKSIVVLTSSEKLAEIKSGIDIRRVGI